MRIMICGSPFYSDKLRLERIFRELDKTHDVINMMCRFGHGADETAVAVSERLGLMLDVYNQKPEYDEHEVVSDEVIEARCVDFMYNRHDTAVLCRTELVIACTEFASRCVETKCMARLAKERGIRFVTTVCGW